MKSIRLAFSTEEEKRSYVTECEAGYERAVDAAVSCLLAASPLRLVTLSGPTCSGKTTTASKLVAELAAHGRRVHVLSIDDFYYNRDVLLRRAEESGTAVDFDSASTIDLVTLRDCVEELFLGEAVRVPQFDFQAGRRTGVRVIDPDERDVLLLEGIQAVYPEVTALFEGHAYVSIFINVVEGLTDGNVTFAPDEIRLFRRIVRDYQFRGATPEQTLKLWTGVRKNELCHILPYAAGCAVQIDSLLPYELSMLKPQLLQLLETVGQGSEFYPWVEEVCAKLRALPAISSAYLPKDSVYHEFLG